MAFVNLDQIKMAEAAFKKSQREAGGKTNKETIKKLRSLYSLPPGKSAFERLTEDIASSFI